MTLGIAGKEAEVIVLRTTESGFEMFVKTVASGYDDSFKRYVQSRLKMLKARISLSTCLLKTIIYI
jgi:hypothetical protein